MYKTVSYVGDAKQTLRSNKAASAQCRAPKSLYPFHCYTCSHARVGNVMCLIGSLRDYPAD